MSNFKEIFYDSIDINVQTGTTYTASLSDSFNYIATKVATNNTIHIPNESYTNNGTSWNFPIGTEIGIFQSGSGTTKVEVGPGVDLRSSSNRTAISGQFAGATLIKFGSNQWKLIGSLVNANF